MEQTITQTKPIEEVLQKRPLIISGPCSAETEEQVMQTAIRLAATNKVDVMRAGIWKPRTRPGSFEGIGTKGLPWLQQARKVTGMPVAVEVATSKQAEDALHFGVDVLWIGARTTVNPFSVQDVADALRGVDVPVLIKNPINPDIELWIGAAERVAKEARLVPKRLLKIAATTRNTTLLRSATQKDSISQAARKFSRPTKVATGAPTLASLTAR